MQRQVITLKETDSMETAFNLFAHYDISFLPVTANDAPNRVVGFLKKSDLVAAYDQQILKDRILSSTSWFSPIKGKPWRKK
jgi:predicted transcriptional regulator